MSKSVKKQSGSPAERILEVASDLFYKQGYRATGINEVIRESGVAKATFYHHFPTKDDLCYAYIKGLSDNELMYMDNFVATSKGALNRFLAPLQSLGPWLIDTKFRGCPFLHMVAEIPDHTSPLRKVGSKLYRDVDKRVHKLCDELIASDKQYAHLDSAKLCEDYMLIFAGAIALAELYHDISPIEQGVATLKRLIGK
jgi:AcrR family transcriptional regulator